MPATMHACTLIQSHAASRSVGGVSARACLRVSPLLKIPLVKAFDSLVAVASSSPSPCDAGVIVSYAIDPPTSARFRMVAPFSSRAHE